MMGIATPRGLQRWAKIMKPVRLALLVGRPPKVGTEAWLRRYQCSLDLPASCNAVLSSSALAGEVFSSVGDA